MSGRPSTAADAPSGRGCAVGAWRLADVLLVFAVVALAGIQAVPAENEAHYLAMARHYWQPSWCSGDLLLQSAAIHRAYYVLFGWVANVVSLSMAAWTGRFLAWLMLAAAWQWLSSIVVPRLGWASISMALLALGNRYGHLSGEWLIGGIEAKTLAYPCVFAGLAAWLSERQRTALILLAAATAWHPLVGGWALATWALTLAVWRRGVLRGFLSVPGAIAAVVAAGLCLIGLLPPILADLHTPPETRSAAWRILVHQRIPHHLLPGAFGGQAWLGFGVVAAILFAMSRLTLPSSRNDPEGQATTGILRFAVVAAALALAGLIAAVAMRPWPDAQASVLRFYWFRQVGVIVPAAAALLATNWLSERRWPSRAMRAVLALPLYGVVLATSACWDRVPAAERPTPLDRFRSWEDACQWVRGATPADALFITPRLRQTFKWYAQRAEVATWKDVPQDAAHIVVWWQRLVDLHTVETATGREWIKSLTQHSPQKLGALGERYKADYLVCGSQPPLPLPLLYHNEHYAVYWLADNEPHKASSP